MENKNGVLKNIIYILLFILLMFILPLFNLKVKYLDYFVYIFLFIITIIFNLGYYKKDFSDFKSNYKKFLPIIVKRYFIMIGLMILVSIPISFINEGNVSTNQQLINDMFKKIPIITLLLTSIYAPLVEESVFRLSLSKLFSNKKVFIIVSAIIFGTLHMIDKFTSIKDLLFIINYSTMGFVLAKSYIDTDNIFVSMAIHFIQNFLAGILVLLYI